MVVLGYIETVTGPVELKKKIEGATSLQKMSATMVA